MISIRRSHERGQADRGWLQARFTFSFADYHDRGHMGFSVLRVINEDRIAAGMGFGPHAHRDMEILTYVLEGRLRHRDSMGQQLAFGVNEMQVMSAGSGVVHSEFNDSASEPVHLFQIWIVPSAEDFEPSYQHAVFSPQDKRGRLLLLASPVGAGDGALAVIHQDARVFAAALELGGEVRHGLAPGRSAWVQVVRGSVSINGQTLDESDGAAIGQQTELSLAGAGCGGEVLLFDLP